MSASEGAYWEKPGYSDLDAAVRALHAIQRPDTHLVSYVLCMSAVRLSPAPDEADSYLTRYLPSAGQSYHQLLGLVTAVQEQIKHPLRV